MSMVLNAMASTREQTTCNSSAFRSTTTRLVAINTCLVPFLLILNLARWTAFAAAPLVVFSVQIISSLDRVVQVTTGQKDVSDMHCNRVFAYFA